MWYKHGGYKTRLYRIWCLMKSRCFNEHYDRYKDYGGRGISIDPRWLNFENFQTWAYFNGYSDGRTLDRIDNNGNYCPENCRWATPKEQSNNRRSNRIIKYNNETHTAEEWSSITGLRANTIITRLNRGWSVKDALTVPVGGKYGKIRKTI